MLTELAVVFESVHAEIDYQFQCYGSSAIFGDEHFRFAVDFIEINHYWNISVQNELCIFNELRLREIEKYFARRRITEIKAVAIVSWYEQHDIGKTPILEQYPPLGSTSYR